jgi:D-sedoheptulose 7-phosphate isomerase
VSETLQERTVNDYLHRLSEFTLQTEVTDSAGKTLSLEEGAVKAVQMFIDVRSGARKVMLCGNGGSAAIVSHVQNDLCESGGVRAMVFTEQPVLTARANDFGYGSVYERPVELWAEPGDLVMTVSSSGKSENIIRTLNAARKKQCNLITFSGFNPDNPSRQLGDLNFYVPTSVYAYVECAHMVLIHYLTAGVTATVTAPNTGVLP